MTLLPGDLIATGTPDGVGAVTGNYLKAGDRMEAALGSWGGWRPRRGGGVTLMGATDGATAAGGRSCYLSSRQTFGRADFIA